jgi:hypothetical protein
VSEYNTPDVKTLTEAAEARVALVEAAQGAAELGGLAGFVDHTLLKPAASAEDIDRICDEAPEYGFASVCVNPVWVRRVAQRAGAGYV